MIVARGLKFSNFLIAWRVRVRPWRTAKTCLTAVFRVRIRCVGIRDAAQWDVMWCMWWDAIDDFVISDRELSPNVINSPKKSQNREFSSKAVFCTMFIPKTTFSLFISIFLIGFDNRISVKINFCGVEINSVKIFKLRKIGYFCFEIDLNGCQNVSEQFF